MSLTLCDPRSASEITDPGVAFFAQPGVSPGTTPKYKNRGTWNAATAYAVNDVVHRGNAHSYICLIANTGQDPVSAPTYWTVYL
jgi:hypothetical protein